MGQLTARSLAAIIGWALCGAGAVSTAEIFFSSRTSLPPQTAVAWGLGPLELAVGIAVIALRSRFPNKAVLNPGPLGLTGLLLVLAPVVTGVLGATVAKGDTIRIGTNTAMLTLLLAVPGIGMLVGAFRLMMYDRQHGRPVQAEPKTRIRKRK
ncbi:MAG: hypothetical protein NT029_13280 [Armatimonadetes bacterium]|nr:hypothetical protein [Armatimonadota bacterium]